MTFFTADLHLDHARIIEYARRPFSSVEEMNETIADRWNERIKDRDTVYVLGDFAFSERSALQFLSRLRGRKILIRGNHDGKSVCRASSWHDVRDYHSLSANQQSYILFHYPIEEWNKRHHGAIHLHGHQHNRQPVTGNRRLDVGVDGNDFRPWHIDEINTLVMPMNAENRKHG